MFSHVVAICLLTNLYSVESEEICKPFCSPLNVLDFSLDSDDNLDDGGEYTHASLQMEEPPSSLTICLAFMVERWPGGFTNSPLFRLLDENEDTWLYLEIFASSNYTEFIVMTSDGMGWDETSNFRTSSLFFPMQWTRVCLSTVHPINSNTSKTTLVVDDKQIVERYIPMVGNPTNLTLMLGSLQ